MKMDTVVFLVIFVLLISIPVDCSKPCKQKDFGNWANPSIVCVCDETYCDDVDPIRKTPKGTFQKFVTSKSGRRFYKSEDYFTPYSRNTRNRPKFPQGIPLIQDAMDMSRGSLRLLAYPSSPPLWMKEPPSWTGATTLKPNHYQTYADYYVKFLNAYENNGIQFWGITTGNAPSAASNWFPFPINSLGWNRTLHARWIGEHLGPTVQKSDYGHVKILLYDDTRDNMQTNLYEYLRNRKCLKHADGVAVQSYGNYFAHPSTLLYVQNPYKELFVLATSAANGMLGYFRMERFVDLGSWTRADYYVQDILANMEYNVTGWLDYSLATNLDGGHTWNGMGFDAPIVVDAERKEFYKQPLHYVFGHFSKFVPPGSVRIGGTIDWLATTGGLQSIVFRRPDAGYVIIVYNRSYLNRRLFISVPRRGTITLDTEAQSITNVLYW